MKVLKIVEKSEVKHSNEETPRKYITAKLAPPAEVMTIEGEEVIVENNSRPIGRNFWAEGPNGSPGDGIYNKLEAWDGKKPFYVKGEIYTVETKPYEITSTQNGEEVTRKVSQFRATVLDGETLGSIMNRNGIEPKGAKTVEKLVETPQPEEVEEIG